MLELFLHPGLGKQVFVPKLRVPRNTDSGLVTIKIADSEK
jgi:hypothetical protein